MTDAADRSTARGVSAPVLAGHPSGPVLAGFGELSAAIHRV